MIILFAGSAESGKSTGAKYIAGLVLKHADVIKDFKIVGQDLLVTANVTDHGIMEFPLDLKRRDYDFIRYAERVIYPHVKIYSFADPMKEFLHKMFGISYEGLYGLEKNNLSKIDWDQMLQLLPKNIGKKYWMKKGRKMTNREVMQIVGTEILRFLYPDCHAEACYTSVLEENSNIALIDDCRFPNELSCGKPHDVKTIKLLRKVGESTHDSENKFNEIPDSEFDYIVPECSLEEKHEHLNIALKSFGLEYLC